MIPIKYKSEDVVNKIFGDFTARKTFDRIMLGRKRRYAELVCNIHPDEIRHAQITELFLGNPPICRNYTGRQIHHLLVLGPAGKIDKSGNTIWKCLCTLCGVNIIEVPTRNLIGTHTTMCADCTRRKRMSVSATTFIKYIMEQFNIKVGEVETEYRINYEGGSKFFDACFYDTKVLEVDSKYFHSLPGAKENDAFKNQLVVDSGMSILRIELNDVKDVKRVFEENKEVLFNFLNG